MKPIIGVNCDFEISPKGKERSCLHSSYYDALSAAGAIPVLLPALALAADLDRLLARVDGVLLSGGDDFDPCRYGAPPHPAVKLLHARRQEFDLLLARRLSEGESELPVLGICCGLQLMAIQAGGALHTDVPSQVPGALRHQGDPGAPADHVVRVVPGTRLAGIVGTEGLANSAHHQSVRDAGGLVVAARSPDGLIEALEDPSRRFYLGVQWHPEKIMDRPLGFALMEAFVAAAGGEAQESMELRVSSLRPTGS